MTYLSVWSKYHHSVFCLSRAVPVEGGNQQLIREKIMFESFKLLLLPAVPKHTNEDQKALRRKAAKTASTGNILVQIGNFVTPEDFASIKRKVLHER